ncbi:hypothetical protein EDC59_101356 [Pseudodesulfovibrio indicus]|uniref:Uncharacterized protein n=1 Tax=Pseudodesulfovibrio indicus TaxID=1716143 RepID=A0AA94PP99_9BACT|nr:hypothetical protein EDC59_101356 [Pseudodesulfovibrio indicus]
MKKVLTRVLRAWSPLAAWTGCIHRGESGELRFTLFD